MHLHLSWQITRICFDKCRRQILSANTFPNGNSKAKHVSMKLAPFTHTKGLLYKHVMGLNQTFLALVIPKSWTFTVLVETHDKLGHQGVNRTYHLIKHQYYWKGMNKVIHKCINNCALCKWEKARTQVYSLLMMAIPDRPLDKIAIDLVSDLNISASRNQHILTIIDNLTGWPEAFPIPDKKADNVVCISTINYLPIHMFPHFILSDNGREFRNQLMDSILKQLAIDCIFPAPYHPKLMENWKFFTNTLNQLLRNCVKMIQTTRANTSTKY